ncbi:gliding motility-associated C-terminal domain-containing protein [Cecembia rubra]|nr:gliding motility-associated C-terminal domain-containing protein [Cecembia rubra]
MNYTDKFKFLCRNPLLQKGVREGILFKFLKISLFLVFFVSLFGQESIAQEQPPSIISGVTFQWEGPQPTTTSPANLVSVTVDEKVYNKISVPSRYELTRIGPNGHIQNRLVENGVVIVNGSDSPSWNANALSMFSSTNLNFIFESDGNGRNICSNFEATLISDTQVQTIFYDDIQAVNHDGIIAISTRSANSCIYIEVVGSEFYGGPEVVLGRFFARPGPSIVGPAFGPPAFGADYWRSGRVNANNGNIGIALFRLDQVAPLGSYITSIRYAGASVNHGDGKVFLIRAESTDLSVRKVANNPTPDYGDLIEFNIQAINNGTLNTTGVQVSDLLPSGFTFVSATASKGTYNQNTGIWNIGSFNYGDVENLIISVQVNPTGDYTNTAEISPNSNDPNLENNISIFRVRPINILAANDLTVNSAANNSNAGNAISNDLINNLPLNIDDVNITNVIPSNSLVTIDTNTGVITVGNVPSGTYTITYTICEVGTEPENSNCTSATITVLVQNQLIANDDSVIGSSNNTNIGNVFEDNGNGPDILNGEKVTIASVIIKEVTSSNPLVTIDVETGNIMVGDVPVGSYQIEYLICESGTDPTETNCSTATVTVEVRNFVIAKDDLVSATANNQNAGNVLEDNGNGPDTFNGVPLTINQITIESIESSDPQVTIDPSTGNISVGNVSSGIYTISYTICEAGTDPSETTCSTAIVTVEVLNIISAKDDLINTTSNNQNAGNVFNDNGNGPDTFNGIDLTISQVNISSVVPSNPEVTIDPTTGNILVGNVCSGRYTISYSICEAGTDPSETTCSTATVTVEVINVIAAKDDLIKTTSNNQNAGNVLEDNGNGPDTFNSIDLTISQVNISSVVPSKPEVTIDPTTGNILVGNVSSGKYTISYTICESGTDPKDTRCATANVTVEVHNLIVANDDVVNTASNNPNAGNVLEDNGNGPDTINGLELTLDQVSISSVVPSNPDVTIDPVTGNILVGNISSGSYEIQYTICEKGANPENCKAALVTVIVENETITLEAIDDIVQDVGGVSGAANLINILDNDLINGEPLNPEDVIISANGNKVINPVPFINSENSVEPKVVLNPDGSVDVASNTDPGTYVLVYSICASSDPDICDSATITVVVQVSTIVANDDIYGPFNGITGATFGNVLANDSIDGEPVKPTEVILNWLSGNPELTLNQDATITLAPNTPSGEYILIYNICDAKDPKNCSTAFVTVLAIGEVDLAIEKTSNAIKIWGSEVFDYFITVSNLGITDATNLIIEDLLPEGISFESQETQSSIPNFQVDFEQQGNKLIWRVSELPAKAVFEIKLSVLPDNIQGSRPLALINNVTVSAEELELNLENNSATDINAINPFFIPNVFTPNGNGFNDTFEIVGINRFEKNELVILNRFGDEIFRAENYRNNWDANGIVPGTYFYILRTVDRFGVNHDFKGWIQVVKK